MSAENTILYVDSLLISPYAMSVFVTLTEKGIPFQIKKVDLEAHENNRPDYAALSITQRVPMLTCGDFSLSESSAISEFLDELYPAPHHATVYPRDIHARARARQIQAWLRSSFFALREERSTEVVFGKPSAAPLSAAAQVEIAKLFAAVAGLLRDGSENLFGEWCIADMDLALMLNRLVLNGDNVPKKMADYAGRQWQRPAVQLWVNMERSI